MRTRRVLWRWLPLLLVSLLTVPGQSWGQATGTVTGVVTGTNGRPLAGASVAVTAAGATRGTQTDAAGRYTITGIPAGNRTIRANFAGYAEGTRTVTVNAAQEVTVNITLTQQALQLEGLVAIGYGETRARDVTGSVATVSLTEVQGSPIISADAALRGMVPGVVVTQASGVPGGAPMIEVRGVGAVGAGSQPLYVVDGVPIQMEYDANTLVMDQARNPLANIPAEDIESLTVLKDAAATSIYGSRGSNGVVLITTKRARATTPQFNITAYTSRQQLGPQGPLPMYDAEQYSRHWTQAARDQLYWNNRIRNPNADPRSWEPTAAQINALIPSNYQRFLHSDSLAKYDYYRSTAMDWTAATYDDAPIFNLQASASGGSERVRTYLSGGFTDQRGIAVNTGIKRFSGRANVDVNLSERLTFNINMAPTFTVRNLATTGGVDRERSPLAFIREDDGTLRRVTPDDPIMLAPTGTGLQANPLYQLRLRDTEERALNALGSAIANLELVQGVAVRSAFNVTRNDTREDTYNPTFLQPDGTFGNPACGNNNPAPCADWRNEQIWSWALENTLTLAPRELAEGHFVDAVVGLTMERSRRDETEIESTGEFPDTILRQPTRANEYTAEMSTGRSGLASMLARLNYNFADRYVVTGTIRRDGSSRFGSASRWGIFPSAAVAWNISSEPFMQDVGFVQDLRLRGSWGRSGNNQIGDFVYIGNIQGGDALDYNFGNTLATGRRLSNMANSELGWEQIEEYNLGLESAFFGGRVDLTADWYRRRTTNLLLDREIPAASGFQTVKDNLGALQNQGIELSVRTLNVDGDRFHWNTTFNVAANRNKVLDLGKRDFLTSGRGEGFATHISRVGEPLAMFFGFKSCGIYQWADDKNGDGLITADDGIEWYSGARVGNIRWCNQDDDLAIQPELDYTVIGNPYADLTWSVTNNATFGPFDLRVLINGALGADRRKAYAQRAWNIDGPQFNNDISFLNRWRPGLNADGTTCTDLANCASEQVDAIVPMITVNPFGTTYFRMAHEGQISNADYAWIRTLNLQYNLPGSVRGDWLRTGSVYLNLDNVWMFTRYKGNPEAGRTEVNLLDNQNQAVALTPGSDTNAYPVSRVFTIGVNLGF